MCKIGYNKREYVWEREPNGKNSSNYHSTKCANKHRKLNNDEE